MTPPLIVYPACATIRTCPSTNGSRAMRVRLKGINTVKMRLADGSAVEVDERALAGEL